MQEYEKRLLAKDHEVKAAQSRVADLQQRLEEASAALADTSRMLPAPEPTAGDCAEIGGTCSRTWGVMLAQNIASVTHACMGQTWVHAVVR